MLTAFEYALSPDYGSAGSVMNSFNRAGTTWVGAYGSLMGVMSNEWGFNGYCITDMASGPAGDYMTFQDGIPNGTNIFLGSGDETTLTEFESSTTFRAAMRESSHKIMYANANFSAVMNNMAPGNAVEASAWWWRTLLVTVRIVVGVLAVACFLLWIISVVLDRKARKATKTR